jgi:formate hydrogenlyase subunit 6/NADH:ubiquinone oxidoreductase subunit I
MLFYYTATGNCLYVAKMMEENPKSIPQELKKAKLEYKDEIIGIVAPIYAGELPKTVRRFIGSAKFEANYFYMILTYGNRDSVAGIWSYNYCYSNGIDMNYIQTIKMVDNYLPAFDMEEQIAMDKKEDEQIKIAIENIQKRVYFIPSPTKEGIAAYKMVSQRFHEHPEMNNGESIIMSNRCVGCQICKQVCPIGNIEVIDGKAKRKNKVCDFCLACVHHCPFQAIDLVTDKNPKARYRHFGITLKDIVKSNDQGEKEL